MNCAYKGDCWWRDKVNCKGCPFLIEDQKRGEYELLLVKFTDWLIRKEDKNDT